MALNGGRHPGIDGNGRRTGGIVPGRIRVFPGHRGNTLAEAGAYAILSALMGLSFVFQLAFLTGTPPNGGFWWRPSWCR